MVGTWSLVIGRAFARLHQGSALVLAAWLIPVLLFANLATLLYVAIHSNLWSPGSLREVS
jgi:hypothetical protein